MPDGALVATVRFRTFGVIGTSLASATTAEAPT
jgi:hypothetical protein